MAGIVSPLPEGCLVAIHGYDGTYWTKIAVDSSGYLRIVADSLPLPNGAAQETTLSGLYNVMRLKNLLLYDSYYSASVEGTASSGDLVISLTSVPVDKIAVITGCGLVITAGTATGLQFNVYDGTNSRPIMRKLSPALNEMISLPPFIVVPPGGCVKGTGMSVGSSTTIKLFAVGYYVKYS